MLFVGCDWSDKWLDFAVLNDAGTVMAERRITYADAPDPVAEYQAFLAPLERRWRSAVTGIEDTGILFARALAAAGMKVVHVDPTRAARHRSALGIAKSDRADARMLAAMVRAGVCRPVVASSPEAQALRTLTHTHRAAVAARVEAAHSLRAALTRFWPAAAAAWPSRLGGLRNAQAMTVLAAAPGPRAASKLTRARLAELLRQAGRTRAVEDEAERLHLLFCRPAMLLDPQVEEAESVRIRDLVAVLDRAVSRAAALEKDMHAHYTRQRHYPLISRIPGIGPVLGAYLLAEIGDRPEERFGSGRSLAAYAGVAPLTWASGTTTRVAFRRASSVHLRSTLHTAAFSLAMQSPGAQHYYRRRRAAGDAHATALRKLGRRLVLCLYRCMSTGLPYDDAVAFGYDPERPDAPALQRRSPLSPDEISHARELLAQPGATVVAVAKAFDVSRQTIYRHVLGRPWAA
ncbi:IS110 family transposase [Streptomyces rubradiris]|uniref:IS110 family transposase n=1 Tax=Streptomyces rubradiris TaxID=285531 RepID=A0ABQ3RDW0_STRRR|nr:IS110 family transposase [Streptomyces rubradiris]GHH29394.1 IS110 family transposase [Streptomyces rubradiris]GHI54000.1 IS110 family transposase [Streptomyces rubradiris]